MLVKVKLTLTVPKVEGLETLEKDRLLTVTLLFVKATAAFVPWVRYKMPPDKVKRVGVVPAEVVFTESELADVPRVGELITVAFRKFWVITLSACTP